MSQQNIYSIQLLNDIHNHFPEILYNPRRFNNIQDLLEYIIEVANVSPYTRGRQQYNSRQTQNNRVNNIRQNVTAVPNNIPPPPPSPSPQSATFPTWVNNSTVPQTFVTTFGLDENPATTRLRMSYNNNNSALINTLLGGLFGDILGTQPLGGINLNAFLNERVPVYPTNEEISNASTTFRANRRQDDICAICQEDIDLGQEARRLTYCNHYFHRDCIDTWFRGNVHCPTCRHDIRDVEENQQTNNPDNRNDRSQRMNNPPPVPDNHRRTNIRGSDNN
jgi:hypothetical protein